MYCDGRELRRADASADASAKKQIDETMADSAFFLEFACSQVTPDGVETPDHQILSKLQRSARVPMGRESRVQVPNELRVALELPLTSSEESESNGERPASRLESRGDREFFLDEFGSTGDRIDTQVRQLSGLQHMVLMVLAHVLQEGADWRKELKKESGPALSEVLTEVSSSPSLCSENAFVFTDPGDAGRVSGSSKSATWEDCRMRLAVSMERSPDSERTFHVQKKQPRSSAEATEQHNKKSKPSGQWSLAEFTGSSRPASHHEEDGQVLRGELCKAGGSHSVLSIAKVGRNNLEGSSASQAANTTSPLTGKEQIDVPTGVRLAHNGRHHCSHHGCVKYIQTQGKCMAHGGGGRCTHPDCSAWAMREGRCEKHGGGQICLHPDCNNLARSLGKCFKHGGGKTCTYPGCTKQSRRKGLCVSHGGILVCKAEGCNTRAATKGLCHLHGGGLKCKAEGCEKFTYSYGYCYRHCREHGFLNKGKCKADGCMKLGLHGPQTRP